MTNLWQILSEENREWSWSSSFALLVTAVWYMVDGSMLALSHEAVVGAFFTGLAGTTEGVVRIIKGWIND